MQDRRLFFSFSRLSIYWICLLSYSFEFYDIVCKFYVHTFFFVNILIFMLEYFCVNVCVWEREEEEEEEEEVVMHIIYVTLDVHMYSQRHNLCVPGNKWDYKLRLVHWSLFGFHKYWYFLPVWELQFIIDSIERVSLISDFICWLQDAIFSKWCLIFVWCLKNG